VISCRTWSFYRVRINYQSILQTLMICAAFVTKLFLPPPDRRLRRTTTSKPPSERALNSHKIPGHTNYAWSVRQQLPSNTGLSFSHEMAVGTIGPFQTLRSLCVIDTNFTILRHFLLKLWRNEILRQFIRTLYCLTKGVCTDLTRSWVGSRSDMDTGNVRQTTTKYSQRTD
jgi:hypothetical protein